MLSMDVSGSENQASMVSCTRLHEAAASDGMSGCVIFLWAHTEHRTHASPRACGVLMCRFRLSVSNTRVTFSVMYTDWLATNASYALSATTNGKGAQLPTATSLNVNGGIVELYRIVV